MTFVLPGTCMWHRFISCHIGQERAYLRGNYAAQQTFIRRDQSVMELDNHSKSSFLAPSLRSFHCLQKHRLTWLFGLVFLENEAKIGEKDYLGNVLWMKGRSNAKIQTVLSKMKKRPKIRHKTVMLSAPQLCTCTSKGKKYYWVEQHCLMLLCTPMYPAPVCPGF